MGCPRRVTTLRCHLRVGKRLLFFRSRGHIGSLRREDAADRAREARRHVLSTACPRTTHMSRKHLGSEPTTSKWQLLALGGGCRNNEDGGILAAQRSEPVVANRHRRVIEDSCNYPQTAVRR